MEKGGRKAREGKGTEGKGEGGEGKEEGMGRRNKI